MTDSSAKKKALTPRKSPLSAIGKVIYFFKGKFLSHGLSSLPHSLDDDDDERSSRRLEAAPKPVRDQTRSIEDRLGRMQLTLDQMNRSQRERDSNSNLNRDMVLLVILVVMIQAVLNWILSARAHQAAQLGGVGGGGAGSGSSNGL